MFHNIEKLFRKVKIVSSMLNKLESGISKRNLTAINTIKEFFLKRGIEY